MTEISRDDLHHVYYWNPRSELRLKRKDNPDDDDFISMNGYQMLFLLNWICSEYEVGKDTCLKIEQFIRKEVLGTSKSEKEIVKVVEEEFNLLS